MFYSINQYIISQRFLLIQLSHSFDTPISCSHIFFDGFVYIKKHAKQTNTKMKYSTVLTLFLACGPSAIMAAPVAQDATPALALRGDGPQPQASPQTAPQGSTATGQKGQKSGNEGILDKVEKILKDVLGGVCSIHYTFKKERWLIL
jgi:hypothetical protein